MNIVLLYLLKYIVLPLVVASIMYVIVHIQLILLHKLVDLGLTHTKRTRINIMTFIATFFAVLILVLVNDYFNGMIA